MEPEGSLPCSKESINGPYHQPDASTLYLPPYFPKIHSNIIISTMPRSSEWSPPFRSSNQNSVCISDVLQVHSISYSLVSSP